MDGTRWNHVRNPIGFQVPTPEGHAEIDGYEPVIGEREEGGYEIVEMPCESRAFGWPTGTVRAILAIGLTTGFMGGVIAAYIHGGSGGAQELAAILGAPAMLAVGFYFNMSREK